MSEPGPIAQSPSNPKRTAPESDYSSSSSSLAAAKRSKPDVEGGDGNESDGKEEGDSGVGGGGGVVIEVGVAEDKGSRHAMEDAWVVVNDDDAAGLGSAGKLSCAHFAIYDGHGGRLAAEYAQKHLHANALSAGLPLGC